MQYECCVSEGGCQLVFCYGIKEQEVVVVHPVERLFSGSDLPLFVPRGLGFIDPLHESVQKGQKRLPQICIQRTMQVYVLRVLCRGAAGTRLAAVGRPAFCPDSREIAPFFTVPTVRCFDLVQSKWRLRSECVSARL